MNMPAGSVLPATTSRAEPQVLRSFSYLSEGCTSVNGNLLLTFGKDGRWQMGGRPEQASPGAGSFPNGNFYIRAAQLFVMGGKPGDWAYLGHSGPNGDVIAGASFSGQNNPPIVYPADAAPLFIAGEYLDVHPNTREISAWVTIWYTPAE
jgi:hypothetical protein